jgi:hypothetical protein
MKFNYNKISCKNVLSLSVLVINSLNYATIQNESQKLENNKIDYHRVPRRHVGREIET